MPTIPPQTLGPEPPAPSVEAMNATWLRVSTASSLRSEEQWLAWKGQEERDKSIEFSYTKLRKPSPGSRWRMTVLYRCSRAYTGGKKSKAVDTEETASKKKRPNRKIGTKKTGCKAQIIVKTYTGRSEYLINYKLDHCHGIGPENIRYCRLPAHVNISGMDSARRPSSSDVGDHFSTRNTRVPSQRPRHSGASQVLCNR